MADEIQLAYFQMKELKNFYTQLGISKQGKKQALQQWRNTDRYAFYDDDDDVSDMEANFDEVMQEETRSIFKFI
ncbi:Chromatin SPT2 [Corchorus capsularis]|uniref:Chromatin SPT2 n=1 Tax=Corchorus capsularis TaxID=210143 RepID=A0A1R3JVE2_COCAP|nr:Chromatin SPT2 [Corchorus capsularis]